MWGPATVTDRLARAFAEAPGRDEALRRMAVAALVERPPTGFLRDVVLEPGGRRRGALDIKRRGLLPIESLARWSGLAAGVTTASTAARLTAAEAAGHARRDRRRAPARGVRVHERAAHGAPGRAAPRRARSPTT